MHLAKLKRFIKDECGASMVEYGVALLVVTGVGVALTTSIGTGTGQIVDAACTVIEGSATTTNTC